MLLKNKLTKEEQRKIDGRKAKLNKQMVKVAIKDGVRKVPPA